MKPRRILSCMMALLLAATMPLTAFAGTYDVAEGSVTVNASESGQTVTHGTNVAVPDSAPVITQSTETTANTVTIHADAWATANVTLSGVNIDTSGTGQAAVEVTGNGDVVIELDGNNTVKSGEKHAGVEKNTVAPTDTVPGSGNGKLTITDENDDGSLKANGGEGGAGIGGGAKGSASNITISGGEVTAAGGNALKIEHGDAVEILAGAGIGGGGDGNGSNITISGGTVNATGGDPMRITNDDGTGAEEKPGGGAGIGGGAYGEGNNIAVKYTAQVTATGKGNAANIGNGYDNKYEGKQQPDNVDLSGLSSFGKVNGVSGSDGGYHASNGSINSVPSIPSIVGHKATGIGGLKVSDNNGNGLANEYLLAEDALNITAPADNVLVTGNKADLLQLKEEGVKKINLQTNRVNVSVSNQVLEKITGSGESFQLTADDTTVSISSTAGNNQKNPGLKMTADKLPEKGKLQVDFRSEESKEGAGDVRESLNKTLQVSTNAPQATLTCDQQYLQTLMDSELRNLVLNVGKVLAAVDSLLAANTTVNGSGSISIGNNTVNMNGIEFSAGDSSENDKLTDLLNNIKFKTETQLHQMPQPQGSSAMVVEVNPKASLQSASLKVPGSALQSLIDQGVEATALSANGKTTSFKNSSLLKQIQDSQLGSTATVTDKPFANDEAKIWPETVVKDGNVIIPADF